MSIAGLFSGIGGLELPFKKLGMPTALLCDVWGPAQRVLRTRFQGVPIWSDVAELAELPEGVKIVSAGFPCTDLSQAGKTAGISGKDSGLVTHVFRLLENRNIDWLILENVRNMLALDKGQAMAYLTSHLEQLGFSWAYRLVNSQFAGVPQRRHRVIFVASRHNDPRSVLFADDEGEPCSSALKSDAFGFYWTEGLRGLGWAQDAVPPLKGGSGLGIASPPGVWVPSNSPGRKLVLPSIEDSEALQGFERGWTSAAQDSDKAGPRWKLVGNAVTVGVSDWLVERLNQPGDVVVASSTFNSNRSWPNAAYGRNGKKWEFKASQWPIRRPYVHLMDVLNSKGAQPLSHRASSGFLERALRSNLRFDRRFLDDVREHVEITRNFKVKNFTSKSSFIDVVNA